MLRLFQAHMTLDNGYIQGTQPLDFLESGKSLSSDAWGLFPEVLKRIIGIIFSSCGLENHDTKASLQRYFC